MILLDLVMTHLPNQRFSWCCRFDLYSVEEVIIPLSNVRTVQSNIGFKIPKGYFGKVHARLSFAMQFTDVGGGVTDSDYRGPVAVIFFNFSNKVFEINKCCRFA